ncbi:HIT family protein [Chitinibacter fontanus]|uniref:HIT family protein n=1 Tax=Chitinibacter fontanus TaxID=1737446 RepID=A0A7D5Z5W7_9NEIS|nr:HIT family protein [Chitinibacter fontanus]QLI82621.1 HIT family protein [Chitinibacter fontanus]
MSINCPLCQNAGGEIVWQNELARVVLADEPEYPGFCRVILQQHAAEMTDLPAAQRQALMEIVWAVETIVRNTLQPTKINVASLGNVVPHVHWHIIPRWLDDLHFPAPIWATAAPNRNTHTLTPTQLSQLRQQLEQLTP